ncbi:TonB family protein [Mucilaginibacter rubeus]|uniref:TonB family protein n=1 Tax=Mucilaginibacter rubeus TaxID=2027860 RepID=A0AAE6JBQ9_9SPHI|nr:MULTISPECIES: energy transducer TonB [Mucilaginibacter]QEM02665.1 TonB family protein [Mucilaginibacter rubeus]QEM15285.1 TonB family protein [Mucilaginibacter gossypii]QTE41986.1 TonB family protein [Mucilaginibacter rubeus]QTE48587.1 TonB family protein [Mucilaginibacter rubeus]QTE59974.1 TonB family protein [Mucilaginibacter rubeus]
MLITKFDLYNAEWLDLVFDHRNKNYGAYELRQSYGRTMAKSMGIAFAAVALLSAAAIIFKAKPKPIDNRRIIEVKLDPSIPKPPAEAKPRQQDAPAPVEHQKPAAPIETKGFTTPHIVPTDPPTDPPTITDLKDAAIGPADVKGTPGGNTVIEQPQQGGGGGGAGKGEEVVTDFGGLEVMPEPVGGAAAWAKFLQKNLRFPGAAQDAGVSGRVLLSFIIEKDGTLSNIKVERPAGYGFDEEALRVLKLAKAWKPGVQNGQNVRVRYSIPISFQLATEE